MAQAEIAASHFEPEQPGDVRKTLVNYYAEVNPGDPMRKMRLQTTPGSRLIGGQTLTSVRGLHQADGFAGGKLVVIDQGTARLMDTGAETWSALTGTLAGSDRVQIISGEVQTAFLANGALYQSAGTAVAALSDADWATLLSDHGQTKFSSIAVIGQRLVATYGSRFAYSDALNFNATTALNWYTAESAPDGLVATKVNGAQLYLFGNQTTEIWVQSGANDDPFRALVGQEINRGALSRDTIVNLDNTIFFVGDDLGVYRLDGLTPVLINASDPWVSRILAWSAPGDVTASAIETEAHKFYALRTPELCMVYDVATQTWHLRKTLGSSTSEWRFHQRIGARHYAAGASSLVEQSRAYRSDRQASATAFGAEIVREFSAHLPVRQGTAALGRIGLEGTKGIGLETGQGADPMIRMKLSRDKGNTFGPWRERSLGRLGNYACRTGWEQNGRAMPEQCVAHFSISDPVMFSPTRVSVGER